MWGWLQSQNNLVMNKLKIKIKKNKAEITIKISRDGWKIQNEKQKKK